MSSKRGPHAPPTARAWPPRACADLRAALYEPIPDGWTQRADLPRIATTETPQADWAGVLP